MLLPEREWQEGYRFGFNGKEKDPEQLGKGNIYDYGFRIYNPRLGKFLSVDPLAKSFPWFSPFQYASNCPILNIDLDGLEGTSYQNSSDIVYSEGGLFIIDEDGALNARNTLDVISVSGKPRNKHQWLKVLNAHTVLDIIGIIDPTGLADGINGLIYLAQGDYVNAAISFISAAPGGDAAKALKYTDDAAAATRIVKGAEEAVHGLKAADDLPAFEKRVTELANELETKYGPNKKPVDGTTKHTEFGKRVREWGYEDVKVEESYLNKKEAKYGTGGSSRPDITIINSQGKPTHLYDYKTGNAKVSEAQRRKNEINTGVKHTKTIRATSKPN